MTGFGVRATEICVEVDASRRVERHIRDSLLEEGRAARVFALVLQEQGERESCARGRLAVAVGDGVCNRVLERALKTFRLAEPDRELEVGEPQLPRRPRVDVRACLEVVGRDAELRGKPPQRLD